MATLSGISVGVVLYPDQVRHLRIANLNGLIIAHYEREDDVRIGDIPHDSPNDREVARRERMKREESI